MQPVYSTGSTTRSPASWRGLIPAAVLVFAATPVLGAEEPGEYNRFEITPFVGHMFGGEFEDATDGSERELDADTNFGVIFNFAEDTWRHYELLYSNQGTQLDGATTLDMDVQYLHLGGTVSNPEARHVIPYFGITFGATQFSPDGTGLEDETELSFTVGGGVRVPITEHIGVRFDARAFITLLDAESEIFCVSAAGATCTIRAKSDTFTQYAASLGVVVGF
jgi:hypothetical protein